LAQVEAGRDERGVAAEMAMWGFDTQSFCGSFDRTIREIRSFISHGP
jgi:hypothetical protein